MDRVWNQLYAVLRTHYNIRKRNFISTFLVVVLPIVTFTLGAYAKSAYTSPAKKKTSTTLNNTMLSPTINVWDTTVLYSPRNSFTDSITRKLSSKINMNNGAIAGFANETTMGSYEKKDHEGTTVIILFRVADEDVPSKLDYDLQMHQQVNDGSDLYFGDRFVAFQWAIDTSFIELITKAPLNVSVSLGELQYPARCLGDNINDKFVFLSLLTVLSFVFLFPFILRMIVPKETPWTKEFMKIDGLKSWTYHFGWYMNVNLCCCISAVIISILLTNKIFYEKCALLQNTDFTQLVSLLLLFCSATTTFLCLFSLIFENAVSATSIGMLSWVFSYAVYVHFANNMSTLSLYVKIIASLMPHIALYHGFEVITRYEKYGSNVGYTEPSQGFPSDDMKMIYVVLMLVIDTLLYFLITVLYETDPLRKYRVPEPSDNESLENEDLTGLSNSNNNPNQSDTQLNITGIDNNGTQVDTESHDTDHDKYRKQILMIFVFYLLLTLTPIFVMRDDGHSNVRNENKTTTTLNLETYGNTTVQYNLSNGALVNNIFKDCLYSTKNNSELLSSEGVKNIEWCRKKYVPAMEMIVSENNNKVNVLYSEHGSYGALIAVNVATNVILKCLTGNSNRTITTSHTTMRKKSIAEEQYQLLVNNILLSMIILPVACLISVTMSKILPILDRKNLDVNCSSPNCVQSNEIDNRSCYRCCLKSYANDVRAYISFVSLPLSTLGVLSFFGIVPLMGKNLTYMAVIFITYGVTKIAHTYFMILLGERMVTTFKQLSIFRNALLSRIIIDIALSLPMLESAIGIALIWIFAVLDPKEILTPTMDVFHNELR